MRRVLRSVPVFAFALMTVALLARLSDATVSKSENRTLAPLPSLLKGGRVNLKFPRQFEAWFNDHVGFRDALMSIYGLRSAVLGRFARKNGCVWDRETGFVWTDRELHPGSWSADYVKRTVRGITDLQNWLGGMGIDFYLLVVPDKAEIYREEAEEAGVRMRDVRGVKRMMNALRTALGDRFVYPVEALMAGKSVCPVYYKTSHHWSEYGAFLGWRETASRILTAHRLGASPSLGESSYAWEESKWIREGLTTREGVGCSARIMGYARTDFPDELLATVYRQYRAKDAASLNVKPSGLFGSRSSCRINYTYPNGAPLRIYATGTSQTCIMRPFMPYTFAEMEYVRLNGGQVKDSKSFDIRRLYEDEIRRFNPDVVLLCLTMGNLYHAPKFARCARK